MLFPKSRLLLPPPGISLGRGYGKTGKVSQGRNLGKGKGDGKMAEPLEGSRPCSEGSRPVNPEPFDECSEGSRPVNPEPVETGNGEDSDNQPADDGEDSDNEPHGEDSLQKNEDLHESLSQNDFLSQL